MRNWSKTIMVNKRLTIVTMYYLKVFNRGLSDTTMKIQHIGLCIFIPDRGLVMQLNNISHVFSFGLFNNRNMLLISFKIQITVSYLSYPFSTIQSKLTFLGLILTLWWSRLIPGIRTDIFLGPLNPRIFVSYLNKKWLLPLLHTLRHMHAKKPKGLNLGLGFQFFEYIGFGRGFGYFANLLQITN